MLRTTVLLASCLVVACGDSSGGPTSGDGSGGSGGSSSAGAPGTGGVGATGGAPGTGGAGATAGAGAGGAGAAGGGAGTPAMGGAAGMGAAGSSGAPATGGAGGMPTAGPLDDVLRVNHIQNEGTHNSYHVDTVMLIPQWNYTHAPLDQQLALQGVRHFELDVHYSAGQFLVYHVPVDVGTTCSTFIECLTVIKTWSDANIAHSPIFILIEPKDELDPEKIAGHYDELETEALSVWPRDRVLAPDDVRGAHPDLRTAILADGWPTLGATRGKIAFFLMGGTSDYVTDPSMASKLMFARGDEPDPWAAILKLEGPESDEAEIMQRVQEGFLVRTRYNGGNLDYVQTRIDASLRSGAHFLSGDFPEMFMIPGGTPSRCNPVNAPTECVNTAIE